MSSHRCNPSICRTGKGQGGAALIVALLVFAVAAALMVGLQRDFTLFLHRASNGLLQEQTWVYLRGAEDLAGSALRFDTLQDQQRGTERDDLTEIWASEATPYALEEGGWLLGQLEDLQGRFNLNNLLQEPTAGGNVPNGGDAATAAEVDAAQAVVGAANLPGAAAAGVGAQSLTNSQRMFVRLLQGLEGAALDQQAALALMDSIIDFMDSDEQPRLYGGEREAYRNRRPAHMPANQALASVSELRAVEGVTPVVYRLLAPLVSVWPNAGAPINVLTAPVGVLRALNVDNSLEPLPLETAQRLAQEREVGQWNSIETLLTDIAFSAGATAELQLLLTETSSWFLLDARVEIADREQHLYSVLERNGQIVTSHYRSLGEL